MTAGPVDNCPRARVLVTPGRGEPASGEAGALRGRVLGCCRVCGRPVFSQQSFTRAQGHVSHVRCAAAELSRPGDPSRPRGATLADADAGAAS